jgi:hypothetical protein
MRQDMRSPTRSSVEKSSFKDSVTPTWTTSVANVTRFVSEKLSAWGVEERGAYRMSTSEHGRLDQKMPFAPTANCICSCLKT